MPPDPPPETWIDRLMRLRGRWMASKLRPWLAGERLLDVGTGDGWVGWRIAETTGCSVTLLDVVDFNRTPLPLLLYDGNRMPFGDTAFDTVMALTVLHHGDDPDRVLGECIRVCRHRLIITESVYHTALGHRLLCALDRFVNRLRSGGAMHGHLQFRTAAAWRSAFADRGLELVHEQWLSRGIHQHILFVLEKTPETTGAQR